MGLQEIRYIPRGNDINDGRNFITVVKERQGDTLTNNNGYMLIPVRQPT